MRNRGSRYNHFAETGNSANSSQQERHLIRDYLRGKFTTRRILVVVLVIALIVMTIIAYLVYTNTRNTSPSSIDGIVIESGYTAVAGNKTVSDGRLSITVNNYHFEEAEDIDWFPSLPVTPTAVFMFVNVTVGNVGSGNASVSPAWVFMQNGSSIIGNTNFVWNVSFPVGVFPSQAYPDNSGGGIYLPPGKEVTFWYLFYVPYSESLGLSGVAPKMTLKALVYYELLYGGNYEGDGAYSGSAKDLKVQFIVLY